MSIATALWPKGDATEEATEPEEQSRRMRQIIDVGQQVFEGIQKFAQKYNQHWLNPKKDQKMLSMISSDFSYWYDIKLCVCLFEEKMSPFFLE